MRKKFKKIYIGDWGAWADEIKKNNPIDYSNSNNLEMPCDMFNPLNDKDKLWITWGLIDKLE